MITMIDMRPHRSWTHSRTGERFCCVRYVWAVWR